MLAYYINAMTNEKIEGMRQFAQGHVQAEIDFANKLYRYAMISKADAAKAPRRHNSARPSAAFAVMMVAKLARGLTLCALLFAAAAQDVSGQQGGSSVAAAPSQAMSNQQGAMAPSSSMGARR